MSRITTRIYLAFHDFIVNNRRVVVTLIHLVQVVLANYLAFLIRFEFVIPVQHLNLFISYLPYLVVIRLVFYLQSGLYKNLWRYSSVGDLVKILKSVTFGSLIFLIVIRTFFGDTSYPRSIYLLDWLLLIMLSGGTRLLIRVFREYLQSVHSGKRTLIIGAGDAGEMIVRDMKNNPKYEYEPVGFIDDNLYKKGLLIHGVPIFGPRTMISQVVEKHEPEEILIAIPSASHKIINEIYEFVRPFNIPIKMLPGMSDILDGTVSVSQIKPLSLEDLLQREPVRTDIQAVKDYVGDKVVLVTGAGGSIGSELCRQIIEYRPSSLILFDRYENGLFEIDLELNERIRGNGLEVIGNREKAKAGYGSEVIGNGEEAKAGDGLEVIGNRLQDQGMSPSPATHHPSPKVVSVVGDMRDTETLEMVFNKYKPQIVFHAAAHKHVPLMENNPIEAVKNNIFGTRNLIQAARSHAAESFVMVSTDKAVNPTNIMGASKRVSEFMAMSMNHSTPTKFITVRFGNVLGSNGSVVHVFREQIKRGGPITVTHPDIKRYFMLIPEAVQLVLIAAASGRGGEIFVLDMGEQIRIADLAENLISLSGFTPHEDIKIEFTGLRPGEKMYEELFDDSEKTVPTFHEKIRSAIPRKIPASADLDRHISALEQIVSNNSVDDLISEIQKIVPNYKKT